VSRRTWWLLAAAIAGLALAASANSVVNGFAYDDVYLIQRSTRMHTLDGLLREFARTYWGGESGGDGYRPLTIIAFRLEWALGGGSPLPFHVVNIALHLAGAVTVFWLMTAVLPRAAAWIAGALYAVHPVHTEAIANVVGQSELAVALSLALGTGLYLHGRNAGSVSRGRWAAIVAVYIAGMLFKEHAIVLPAILLLAEATIVRDRTPWRQRVAALRPAYLVLAAVGLGYLWARSAVVVAGIGGFKPYVVFQALQLSTGNRVLTMIGLAPEWVRLLLWPARLMTEYAPLTIEVAQGVSASQLPGLLVLLGTLGLAVSCWRRSPAATFGIGFLALSLLPASNFLIPAGFIIAERTLLSPSIGAMIAVGSAVPFVYARIEHSALARRLGAALVLALLAGGITRSTSRNRAWFDNETLFRQAIVDSPDSYRAHFMLGLHLFQKQWLTEGERHFRESIRLFPHDALVAYAMAEQYRANGRCQAAVPYYRALFALVPEADAGHTGFAICLLETGQWREARAEALQAIRSGGRVAIARAIIAAAKAAMESVDVHGTGDIKAAQPASGAKP